jgi:hypothetical protein
MNRQQALQIAINSIRFRIAKISENISDLEGPVDLASVEAAEKILGDCNQAIAILQKEISITERFPRKVN